MLGIESEEWINGNLDFWLGLIHPEDRDTARSTYYHSVETGASFDMEYRMNTRDGRTLWMHDKAFVLPDPQGNANMDSWCDLRYYRSEIG